MSEHHRILSNLSSMADFNTTTDKATARKILESEFVICQGVIRFIQVERLGLGVYKIYTRK